MYGANGAGKTNLIKSMKYFVDFIKNSFNVLKHEIFQHVNNSEFKIAIIHDNTIYEYGFILDDYKVKKEWLYSYKKRGSFVKLFERNEREYKFSPKLKGYKNDWKKHTREDTLFLTMSSQLNSTQLLPVFNVIASTRFSDENVSNKLISKHKENLIKVLEIDDLCLHEEYYDRGHSKYEDIILKRGKFKIFLSMESSGIKKLVQLYTNFFEALENNKLFIVDDLETNLHQLKAEEFINTVYAEDIQLLFTTHLTTLLNKNSFCKSSIWFASKDYQTQKTSLFSLSDFSKLNKGHDWQNLYLEGDLGAIPCVF